MDRHRIRHSGSSLGPMYAPGLLGAVARRTPDRRPRTTARTPPSPTPHPGPGPTRATRPPRRPPAPVHSGPPRRAGRALGPAATDDRGEAGATAITDDSEAPRVPLAPVSQVAGSTTEDTEALTLACPAPAVRPDLRGRASPALPARLRVTETPWVAPETVARGGSPSRSREGQGRGPSYALFSTSPRGRVVPTVSSPAGRDRRLTT